MQDELPLGQLILQRGLQGRGTAFLLVFASGFKVKLAEMAVLVDITVWADVAIGHCQNARDRKLAGGVRDTCRDIKA